MTLAVPVVWSDACLAHDPRTEVWLGVPTPGTEVPARATTIRDALLAAGATLVTAQPHDDTVLSAVHDPGLLHHLRTVHERWVAAGFPADPGQDRVVPYLFPTPGLLDGLPEREPPAVHAAAGRWCYDTMTLVGPGTWTAARAAVDVALSAADLVVAGAPLAYALTRPPGHHVTRRAYGGSCYLGSTACAAQAMARSGARVAVVDLDAHHGNGTQAVFYDRVDVLTTSLHVDPAAGWFPHYAGHADEVGTGAGRGANRNAPLPPATGDSGWLSALDGLLERVADFRPDAVVVALGVDAAVDDPESPLAVTADGYGTAGMRVAALGVPIVAVQEGGYHLPTLGGLVRACLDGLAGVPGRAVAPVPRSGRPAG